jgi:hypothetical protein
LRTTTKQLGTCRETLLRILGGVPVRAGSIAIVEMRLRELESSNP